jgi:hypothetical protein
MIRVETKFITNRTYPVRKLTKISQTKNRSINISIPVYQPEGLGLNDNVNGTANTMKNNKKVESKVQTVTNGDVGSIMKFHLSFPELNLRTSLNFFSTIRPSVELSLCFSTRIRETRSSACRNIRVDPIEFSFLA